MAQGGNAWEWTETGFAEIRSNAIDFNRVITYGGRFSSGAGNLSYKYSTSDNRGVFNGNEASVAVRVAMVPITQAPVPVVAAAKTKTFGSADPELTYTASGLIGSDA